MPALRKLGDRNAQRAIDQHIRGSTMNIVPNRYTPRPEPTLTDRIRHRAEERGTAGMVAPVVAGRATARRLHIC